MYKLYTIPGTCSTGIAVLLEKLGVPYELIKRDEVPNYTDIVPTNSVPALEAESGEIVIEGAAIALYLLEKHENNMLPTDIEERKTFYQWLNFAYATVHPSYSKLFTTAFKVELEDDIKADLLQQLGDQLSAILAILDEHLNNQKFVLGSQPTHIDYMVAIYTSWNHYFPDTKIILGNHVKRHVEDVMALPEFQAAYTKEKTEYKKAA